MTPTDCLCTQNPYRYPSAQTVSSPDLIRGGLGADPEEADDNVARTTRLGEAEARAREAEARARAVGLHSPSMWKAVLRVLGRVPASANP